MYGQKFSAFVLKLFGWKYWASTPNFDKCVLVVAPHTSNWDFPLGKLGYTAMGRNANFVIKKEWIEGPLGGILTKLGGIGVDRSKASHFTDQMAELYQTRDKFSLAITPEGTRKANPRWKKGFWHIAAKAGVPIVLVRIDYGKKEMSLFHWMEPSGDENADLKTIQNLYRGSVAKHPDQFVLPD